MHVRPRNAASIILALVAASSVALSQTPAVASSGLRGVVIDSLGAPIPYVQVGVPGKSFVTADEEGKFFIPDMESGKQLVQARRVGYDPVYFEIELPAGSVVSLSIRMQQNIAQLSTVDVSDVREPLRRVGFYARMAAGNGHFIPPETLERTRPIRATDAFMNIPNLVVDRRGNKSRVMTSNYRCEYAMVIDKISVGEAGSRVRTTSPDDLVSGSDLYAIEIYPRNRGLPPEFLALSHEDGCGTIVIWTKGMIAR